MGSLLTDRVWSIVAANQQKFGHILDTAETPEFTGHVIWALCQEPDLMGITGKTLIGAEVANLYGITGDERCQPLPTVTFSACIRIRSSRTRADHGRRALHRISFRRNGIPRPCRLTHALVAQEYGLLGVR
jgi:hypothetical protein